MTETKNQQTKNGKQDIPWVKITIAIITVIGVIFSGAGVEWVKMQFKDTPSPTPTEQVTIPDTPILADEPTAIQPTTSSPPINVIEDWKSDCISTKNWQTYLANQTPMTSANCYNLAKWGIVAENGNLYINKTDLHNSRALEFGILTDIRGKSEFEFSVRISELTSSEVWIGFLEGNTPKSNGVIVVIQRDDNIDVRSLPTGKEFVDNAYLQYAERKYEPVKVEFNGAQIHVSVNNVNIIKRPIDITPTKLFMGYRVLPNAEINAVIYNVKME